ncbi:MAG: gliding motility lipoprotein GldD [Mangrovibacterium sp.]
MSRFLVSMLFVCFFSCQEAYVPKPRAYFRISFPEKNYWPLKEQLPFVFDVPDYLKINNVKAPGNQLWLNLSSAENKVDIHLSYEELHNDLDKHIEEARKLAYDHSIKADAINEQVYLNDQVRVFGVVYRIRGNAASSLQFFLTDSVTHFIRGAFYVREVPNIDSIQPVIDFYEPDVIRLIESFEWINKN